MAFKKLKYWFDHELAEMLADKLKTVNPTFAERPFIKSVDAQINTLELKDRVEVMADALYVHLGSDYPSGIKTLIKILGPENEEETGMFTNFYWIMPIAKYVEKYGLNDFALSMEAIEEITKRNTGEYTIRPYIEKDVDRTLKSMLKWSKSTNRHVRRLSCEGLRPRLPWASKLDMFIQDPAPIIPILSNLKDDPSKYVQKSVANCLNDILKDNFDLAKQLIEEWIKGEPGKERRWIIKHALRNLIKKDNAWASKLVNELRER